MAVQLARLSLWLATLAADRPLRFLDHRLQVGDSLLGAWLALLRPRAVRARRRRRASALPLFDGPALSTTRCATRCRFGSRSSRCPNDTLEQVRAKERALAGVDAAATRALAMEAGRRPLVRALVRDRRRARAGAAFGALSDAILTGHSALPPRDRRTVSRARPRQSPRRGGSSTGSSSSRRCSSTRTAAPARTPASTPSSATRRGT